MSVVGLALVLARRGGENGDVAAVFSSDAREHLLGWPLLLAGALVFAAGLRWYFGAIATPAQPPLPRAVALRRAMTAPAAVDAARPSDRASPGRFPAIGATCAALGFVVGIVGLALLTSASRAPEIDSYGVDAAGDAAGRMVGGPILILGILMFLGGVVAIADHLVAANRR